MAADNRLMWIAGFADRSQQLLPLLLWTERLPTNSATGRMAIDFVPPRCSKTRVMEPNRATRRNALRTGAIERARRTRPAPPSSGHGRYVDAKDGEVIK